MRLKPQRLKLYVRLRNAHLSHREALDFSRLKMHTPPSGGKKQYPPSLHAVVKERRAMWSRFAAEARDRGWGAYKQKTEWRKRIVGLYDGLSKRLPGVNFFVTKDVHGKPVPKRISPWALYDAKQKELPDRDQWDTPRGNRRGKVPDVPLNTDRRYREKKLREDIDYYKRQIKETGDPEGAWAWKLKGAEYQLRTGGY